MVMGVNKTNCGDRFTINTNIESLCCTLETNMFYVSCITIKKEKECGHRMMTWALAGAPAIWYVCISSKHDHPFSWAWWLLRSVSWGSQRLRTTANVSPGSGRCESQTSDCHLQSCTVPQRFMPQSSTVPSCTLPGRVCYTDPLCYWDICAHSVFS